jgi:N-acetylglucosaminyl-diphospho-decaprenol L-rhamnosyltransferase
MSVCAVVVSYNVRELLLGCVASLEEARAAGVLSCIIVVDNASTDASAQAVRERFPRVTVIEAPNRGYGAGANAGIAASTDDSILVLNPDTIVPYATIARLESYLREHTNVGIAAPRLRYPDGTIQSSRRRFPARLTPVFESTVFDQWWPGNPWSRAYKMEDRDEDTIQDVDWVVGACLMVRREALETAGEFDESFWMYCEEIEWCWRLSHHGWRISYLPDVEIIHHEGASTLQNVPQRQLAFDRSRVELQRRMYGRAAAGIAVFGIKAGYLAHFLSEGVKFALGHRRELRRTRMQLYGKLLRSSLHFQAGEPS